MSQISVIVPIYKVELYLARCVDSLLAQTYTDYALTLVDDGSPDTCSAMCDEYALENACTVVIHQHNAGLSAARNSGIDLALATGCGDWITFIDSDDWVHPQYLEALYSGAKSQNVSLCACGYQRTDGNPPYEPQKALTAKAMDSEAFYCLPKAIGIVAWGKLYRKELFGTVRYPVGKLHEDEFTTYKVVFANQTVAYVDSPLYYYYRNPNGIMLGRWSPQRMNAIDAISSQMGFFQKQGYRMAYLAEAGWLIQLTYDQLVIVSEYPEYSQYAKLLKKQFHKYLRQYGKLAGFWNDYGRFWVKFDPFVVEARVKYYSRIAWKKIREEGFFQTVKKCLMRIAGKRH